MGIEARITKGIKYCPYLCRKLKHYKLDELSSALSKDTSFFLDVNKSDHLAISWWVSAKRTRSYPYTRVYNTLNFSGKKVTIIPIFKDEGENGDRDYLQWDTVSLMSLLGVFVIIAYYKTASKNPRHKGKITNQRFDTDYVRVQINELLKYHADSIHWNREQAINANVIGNKAINAYEKISKELNVKMNSKAGAEKKINELMADGKHWLASSRSSSEKSQRSESNITHAAENVDGTKATITIKNNLGGYYYLTVDETKISGKNIFLVEAKHTSKGRLPSVDDIKTGLVNMMLYTNLEEVQIGKKLYSAVPILKLTASDKDQLNKKEVLFMNDLKKEATANRFRIEFNGKLIG